MAISGISRISSAMYLNYKKCRSYLDVIETRFCDLGPL